jgi:hypothetical protein
MLSKSLNPEHTKPGFSCGKYDLSGGFSRKANRIASYDALLFEPRQKPLLSAQGSP